MCAVEGEVLGHEVSLADEMVLFDGDRAQVVVDRGEDGPQTVAALRSGCVVRHVFGDELVEGGVITDVQPLVQLVDDCLRITTDHEVSLPRHGLTPMSSVWSAVKTHTTSQPSLSWGAQRRYGGRGGRDPGEGTPPSRAEGVM